MLETGRILIVMGVIFAVGAVGEWILSLFYGRYLRDTADMGRPGKKLVKLTKLRYETSYYLNGTVHNAKTMVDGMLENYRLAGLRLWTWHHIATMAAFLCGAVGLVIGGVYVVGRYIPAVRTLLPLSGMNALVYTLAGASLAAMLIFWQNLLDNRTKRRRLEANLVDYFDNEKFHQLGREIALSGRVREIAGDRGRREDPGSVSAWEEMSAATGAAAAEEMDMGEERERTVEAAAAPKASARKSKAASAGKSSAKTGMPAAEMTEAVPVGGITIGDILSPEEAVGNPEQNPEENAARARGTRKKTAASSARSRAKNVQIAEEEMAERKAGGIRRKEKATKDVIIPLHPEPDAGEISVETDGNGNPAETEAAATAVKRRRPAEKSAASLLETGKGGAGGAAAGSEVSPGGNADRVAREEELLKLLREYMGL